MKKLTYRDYFRGLTSIVWIVIIVQCVGFLFGELSFVMTGMYFIVSTCTLGLLVMIVDERI
jgi:hypothetical protein